MSRNRPDDPTPAGRPADAPARTLRSRRETSLVRQALEGIGFVATAALLALLLGYLAAVAVAWLY